MRILHFVTGGFSGATSVAVDLVCACNETADIQSLLVLRRKKNTSTEKLTALHNRGVDFELVTGRSHWGTIRQLVQICRRWQPDILVVHGFPEHLLGRWAGRLAKVPHMIQIEHNSRERYTPWKRWQTRYLSRYTDCVVGVSEGVAEVLRRQQLHAPIRAIANGIDTQKFVQAATMPVQARPKDMVMVGRFARSKDQITVIKAVAQLQAQGQRVRLLLVGAGKASYQRRAWRLVQELGLDDQVVFCTHSDQIAQILAEHKIFVLASFFEGLNLSVIEAMAAGCVVVGSDTVGVRELIDNQVDGFLFPEADVNKLAAILTAILAKPEHWQDMTQRSQLKAQQQYDKAQALSAYLDLFYRCAKQKQDA